MIKASFIVRGKGHVGFTLSGHSGYADAGSDIVCAAVTSAVRYAECVMNDILGCEVPFEVDEESAAIAMKLGSDMTKGKYESCAALIEGLYRYLTQLQDEFPDNIDVLEV